MIPATLDTYFDDAMNSVRGWDGALTAQQSAALATPAAQRALLVRSFVDGYWRIRRTEPMIELAAEAFERRGDAENAAFWRAHRMDEAGHDVVMRADIEALAGGSAACDALLQRCPITPPSAALVGYFEWQVRHNDPHLLIVMRYFLESFFAHMDAPSAAAVHAHFSGGSATLAQHREADADHVEPCRRYIAQNLAPAALPALRWSIDFLALSLRESQAWNACAVLAEVQT